MMNFNSIKVQLELSVQFGESEVLGFQFHKGTIRTDVSTAEKVYDANFNSIKVQLERKNTSYSIRASKFQFHKGTIRTFGGAPRFALLPPHFNSIKVQLEPAVAVALSADSPSLFQFHKGTIRTVC